MTPSLLNKPGSWFRHIGIGMSRIVSDLGTCIDLAVFWARHRTSGRLGRSRRVQRWDHCAAFDCCVSFPPSQDKGLVGKDNPEPANGVHYGLVPDGRLAVSEQVQERIEALDHGVEPQVGLLGLGPAG